MREFTEKLIELLENPNTSEDTKEAIIKILSDQANLENDLLNLINKAIYKK